MTHTLDGELRVTGVGDATQKLDASAATTLPETIHMDLYAQVTDALGLSVGARWTNWSRFDELRVRFAGGAREDEVTPENWHDNWMLKIGLDYAVIPGLVVRGGFAWDQSPIEDATFRTPRIPDARRATGSPWDSATGRPISSASTSATRTSFRARRRGPRPFRSRRPGRTDVRRSSIVSTAISAAAQTSSARPRRCGSDGERRAAVCGRRLDPPRDM